MFWTKRIYCLVFDSAFTFHRVRFIWTGILWVFYLRMRKRFYCGFLTCGRAWVLMVGWMLNLPGLIVQKSWAGDRLPLVGAMPEEVVATSSTTVNLHTLVGTFYHPRGKKTKILADELNFPSDIYALESQIRLKGLNPRENLVLIKSRDGRFLEEEDIVEAMKDEVALVLLPSVLYRSGQLLDIEYLARKAGERGIPIGFDCSHSIGAVPHYFNRWGVDFAFWCNYKYMNNGPGGVASLYINKRHFTESSSLAGWWGYRKDKQFEMSLEFEKAEGAGGWQIGTLTS